MRIAKVEPMTTARTLRGPFDYLIPDDWPEPGVGALLIVPFAGRRLLGVIVELVAESNLPTERLSAPLELLESSTTPELIELAGWIAERYCSTRARGIALALPPGAGTGRRPRAAKPRIEVRSRLTAAGQAALAPDGDSRLGERQRAALEALAEGGELSNQRLRELTGADGAVVKRLVEREFVESERVAVRRRPGLSVVGAVSPVPPMLSAAQLRVTERIRGALQGRGERELLLYGVTGSGKTEVYLDAIEATIAAGRTAILLVPEIGLTPQTLGRVIARLGDQSAVLHSGLSEGERFDEWSRLASGAARVCVGPRSAVFAPLGKLGLIVVDEEHDPSYKQEGDPRYDARTVARRRAEADGAVYLAGSATPRPESWAELSRLELPERIDSRPMPRVTLLDMRGLSPRSGPLHPEVRSALGELGPGEKAIVMLNRRGFSPHLSCGSCGHAICCPHCEVCLVLHRAAGRLSCHHCGHSEPVASACPECGSVALARFGAGTERIEALIGDLIAPTPVFRLDADAASRKGSHERLLSGFGAADGGVLVGTQMVAKGHDFTDVVLSVLLDADSTLRYPDFRAEERTFALVSQLAGRSGRGERGGRVLVQTLAPDAEPIAAAAAHDAPAFLAGELKRRRAFDYPPYSSLVAIELAGGDEARLAEVAERIAAEVAPALPAEAELLGPAPRFRRRGKYRRRILIKSRDPGPVSTAVAAVVERLNTKRSLQGLTLAVDVDPQ